MRSSLLRAVPVALLACATAVLSAQTYAPATRTLIKAGHVLDVHTGKSADNQTIVITGDTITSIDATTPAAQPGDKVIDLSKYTVLPGLIDMHTHLTMDTDFNPLHMLTSTPAKEGISGVIHAKETIDAGFTTVRNVGASDFSDIALRDAIKQGRIAGPRIVASGPSLGITGGHCDDNLLPYDLHVQGQGVADGIDQVQHKVRENIKYGADVIKICATGGVMSYGDDPQASQYTFEEMKAIVADAHRLGRKVAAHAHGAQGIEWASNAGIDSIEHGSYLNDVGIAAMKKNGTYLVPTLYLEDWQLQYGHLPEYSDRKMREVSQVAKSNTKKAYKAGVKIALGTDAAVYPHGLNAHELDVYVNQIGMTPLEAIQTATVNAADLLGPKFKVGSIESGKWADIIAIEGDPLSDVKLLQSVPFVMQGGVVYKDQTAGK